MLYQKIGRHTIPKNTYKEFRNEFFNWIKLISSNEKTHEDIEKWLEEKYKEYAAIKKDISRATKKPIVTPSGFIRRIRSKMSIEDRASVVIDELIHRFKPQLPKDEFDTNLDIDYYKEDWQQELWAYCWEVRLTDPNLGALILNYNSLSSKKYIFHSTNFLSRMNKYTISYIARLRYSSNAIARYNLTDKYREEELYPADDLSAIDDMNIDLIEKPNYIVEDVDITKLDNTEIVNDIISYFDKKPKKVGYSYKTWNRYKIVLQMRYGLNPENRIYSLAEIGRYFGVTRERARQMESAALRQVRKYLSSKQNKGELL